jgi:hypothetical protein
MLFKKCAIRFYEYFKKCGFFFEKFKMCALTINICVLYKVGVIWGLQEECAAAEAKAKATANQTCR